MQNRWFHRPALHTPSHGHERKVGWLELFYDLIYVATIIQLGNALVLQFDDVGFWRAFVGFAALFVPVWLTWMSFTFYSNRFVVDDFFHRTITFLQMMSIGAVAVNVGPVFDGATVGFSLAYGAARVTLVVMYARTWFHLETARDLTRTNALGFGIGASLWLVSALVPPPWTYAVWILAGIVDIVTPLTPKARAMVGRYPPDVGHMTERFGLFTIIVLGEGFVKVLTEVAAKGPSVGILGMAAASLIVTCSLWWIYFDDVAGSRIRSKALAPFVWVYSHLPLTIAVTAVGVAVKKVVFFDPQAVVKLSYASLVCGSLGLSFLWVGVIDAVTERRVSDVSDRARVNVRIASGFFVLLLIPVGPTVPAWLFLTFVALACAVQVAFDMNMAPQLVSHDMVHEGAQSAMEALTTSGAVRPRPSPRTPGQLLNQVVRTGAPSELKRDFYVHFMESTWRYLMGMLVVCFLFVNVVFASLYLMDPGGVTTARPGSFADAFSFSVQTFCTIGYGVMSPVTTWSNTLVAIEAFISIIGIAVVTGLVFAKASRPSSPVLFSDKMVVSNHGGKLALVLRVGNARGSDIVEAQIHAVALVDIITPEGQSLRQLVDLKLRRSRTPLFAVTWTVFHDIDEDSPLYGATAENLAEKITVIIVTLTGHDATYAQSTHSRQLYQPADIHFDSRFSDVITMRSDGAIVVDYDHFHDVEPV